MKFSCLQENISRGLSTVSKAISVKAPLPILENVLINAHKGEVELIATDLKLGIRTVTGAKVEKEGSLAVPAKILSDLVNTLPKVNVEFSEEKKILTVQTTQTGSKINGLSAEEFPKLAPLPEAPIISLQPKAFSEAVSKTGFAAASDDGRPILTGIFIQFAEKEAILVGVDGFRLAEFKFPAQVKEAWQGVVPAKATAELARVFSGESGEIQVYDQKESGEVIFSAGNTTIYAKLLEGEFPEYKKIIPQESKTTAKVNLSELMQSIKTVNVFAALESGSVISMLVNPAEKCLQLSALAGDVGENKTTVDADISGEEIKIAFNAKYLTDYLSTVKDEQVEILFNDSLSPAKFISSSMPHYTYIVMPVRVQS